MTLPAVRSVSSPQRWDPFGEFEDLHRQLGRWLDSVAASVGDGGRAAEVRETDEAYLVEVELPGVRRGDITVELAGRELAIKGEWKERRGLFRRRVRRTGRFAYRVTLPGDVDSDIAAAALTEGVLTVRVPKTEAARRRRIPVKGA
jgi:HSP20 family protein